MRLENKRIVVIGGAGFIGSHLTEQLAVKNSVIVYDSFDSAVVTSSWLTNLDVRVVRGDVSELRKLSRVVKGADIVFHLAAAHIRLSLSNPRKVHEVNTTGVLTSLLAAKAGDVQRFIYTSSSEAYGTAQGLRMRESHEKNPTTVYGMSKYMGELYVDHFHRHEGLTTIIIRPFNTYGPRSHFEGVYGEVIPRFVVRALTGAQPIIFGDGAQTRDFTYVTDTVRGIALAAQSEKLVGSEVNIAYGQEISIERIAKTVCKLTGLPYQPILKPRRPNDVRRHAADISKAKRALGYKPQVSIEAGLAKYIAWVKQTYPNLQTLIKKMPDTNW